MDGQFVYIDLSTHLRNTRHIARTDTLSQNAQLNCDTTVRTVTPHPAGRDRFAQSHSLKNKIICLELGIFWSVGCNLTTYRKWGLINVKGEEILKKEKL